MTRPTFIALVIAEVRRLWLPYALVVVAGALLLAIADAIWRAP